MNTTHAAYDIPASVLDKDRDQLEALLDQLLDQALHEVKGALPDRWTAVEAMYRMEPGSSGAPIFPDWEVRPTPLLPGRIDRLTNSVWAGLTASAPYCQAAPDTKDQDSADELEAGIHRAAEKGGVDEALRQAVRDAALCGVGILWAAPGATGVTIQAIHPRRFALLPNYAPSIRESSFCGHAFYLPRWRVEELGKGAGWKSLPEGGGDDPDQLPAGYSPGHSSGTAGSGGPGRDFEAVELWHILCRLKIGSRSGWWSMIYARSTRTLLWVEPYLLVEPWYCEVVLQSEGGRWWPSGSVGFRLQGLQHSHTQLCAIREQGTMFSAFGLMVGPEGLKNQLTSFRPGQVLKGSPGFPIQAIFPPFNPSISLDLIAQIESQADAAVGISRLGAGQQLTNATATEASFLRAVTEQAENSYASSAARGLERLYGVIHASFLAFPTVFRRAYGASLGEEFWRSLNHPVRWKSAGRSMDNAPSVQMQKLQAALLMSREPGSTLDPAKTEQAVLRAMQLPLEVEQLTKNNQMVEDGSDVEGL